MTWSVGKVRKIVRPSDSGAVHSLLSYDADNRVPAASTRPTACKWIANAYSDYRERRGRTEIGGTSSKDGSGSTPSRGIR